MTNLWFTADTHFWHDNIILHCNRPWCEEGDVYVDEDGKQRWVDRAVGAERAAEMTEDLIDNWNDRVRPGDRVYHLGDVAMVKRMSSDKRNEMLTELFSRLNGQIHLLCGNHDKPYLKFYKSLVGKRDGLVCVRKAIDLRCPSGTKVTLCHRPFRSWAGFGNGSWNLFGHHHGNLPDEPKYLALDVGIDCWDYAPVNWSEVRKVMLDKLPDWREYWSSRQLRAWS